MYEQELLEEGFSLGLLKEAQNRGWIKKDQVKNEKGEVRNAYLWIEKEMPQRETLKKLIDKAYRYFRGEYEEYYGG